MIIISPSLVVLPASVRSFRNPAVLYANLATSANIAADHEDADYPATNLGNPDTSSLWKSGSTADQVITVTLDGTVETEAVGVARHNFGSGLVTVSIWGLTAEPGAVLTELVGDTLLGDDSPALFVFDADFYVQIEVHAEPDAIEPQAAVLYVGPLLSIECGIAPGHVPLKYARTKQDLNGSSMNGDYRGKVTLSQSLSTSADVRAVDPDWYRENVQPFVDADVPFFFAWNAADYPDEVGFAWLASLPQPRINYATGQIDATFQMGGLAL